MDGIRVQGFKDFLWLRVFSGFRVGFRASRGFSGSGPGPVARPLRFFSILYLGVSEQEP